MRSFLWTLALAGMLALAPAAGRAAERVEQTTVDIDGFTVTRTTEEYSGAFLARTDTFSVADGNCRIEWVVALPSEGGDGGRTHQLSTRLPYDADCPTAFADRLPMHRAALKAVFAAWPAAAFGTYTCPSFASMNPSGDWNVAIAEASIRSPDYADYRRNYPHHASGKHINTIFVEIVNACRAYRDLAALFADNGVDLTLTHVEKVFSQTVGAATLGPVFRAAGLADDQRVLYDAGIYDFRLAPRSQ
jgi:hypothetical protein